jgi:hypothetical protein
VWEDEGTRRSTALSRKYSSNALRIRDQPNKWTVTMKETHHESHTSKGNPYSMPSQSHLCNARSGMKQSRQTLGDKNSTRRGRVGGANLEYTQDGYVCHFSLAWHIRCQGRQIIMSNNTHTKRRQQLDELGLNRSQAQCSSAGEICLSNTSQRRAENRGALSVPSFAFELWFLFFFR